MVAAVLDIGSNSVLLLTARLGADGDLDVLDTAIETTRLGAGLEDGGRLQAGARERTTRAVRALADRARARGATVVYGFATGAARRAVDGCDFVAELARIAGLTAEVLSGEAEAVLAYRAAARADVPACAVADIGGGTTEITLGHGATVQSSVSLPLGALALTEAHGVATDPAASASLRAAVTTMLASQPILAAIRDGRVPLVASGGTATALAALALGLERYDPVCVHGFELTRAALDAALVTLARPGPPPPGLDAGRAEILPAGALVLASIMDAVVATRVRVSDRGVRHAYLLDRLRERPAEGASS